jgi:parvulin-like peptidyl-prolyl isomerase
MKREFVASILCLALAGCAQSRSTLSKNDSPGGGPGPVAMTPVPSVYDTVNRGMGGDALAQRTLPTSNDPRWSGRAPIATAGNSATAAGASAVPPSAPAVAATTGAMAQRALPAPAGPAGAPDSTTAVASAPAAIATQSPPILEQKPAGSAGPEPAPVTAAPATIGATHDEPAPAPLAATPGSSEPGAMPAAASAVPATMSPTPAVMSPSPPAGIAASAAMVPRPDAAVSPTTIETQPASSATAAAAKPRQSPVRDPLLGPDPDLMPPMPDLSEIKAARKSKPTAEPAPKTAEATPKTAEPAAKAADRSPAPAEPATLELTPAASAPADPPAAAPAGAGAGGANGDAKAPELPPLPESSGNTGATTRPIDTRAIAAAVPLVSAPIAQVVTPATSARTAAPGRPAPPRLDREVIQTGLQKKSRAPELKNVREFLEKGAGGPVARVGDEIITFHDLRQAIGEKLKEKPQLQAELRSMTDADPREANRMRDYLVRQILEDLIDQSLLAQEAKRHVKDAKMLDRVNEEADKIFEEITVAPLKRQFNVDSTTKLKERLADQGRSLDAMRRSFRQIFLGESYLRERIKDRMKVDLPDQLKYYHEHKVTKDFDRPAQTTWRELVVETSRYPNRERARQKAVALLERLKAGEDFAKLAMGESDGPERSRKTGGLMQTSPGGYGVAVVNQALDSLPIGQVSEVLEGPSSFHIVKVEGRRAAGPASFGEVQKKIEPVLANNKLRTERTAFIEKLHHTTLIERYLN